MVTFRQNYQEIDPEKMARSENKGIPHIVLSGNFQYPWEAGKVLSVISQVWIVQTSFLIASVNREQAFLLQCTRKTLQEMGARASKPPPTSPMGSFLHLCIMDKMNSKSPVSTNSPRLHAVPADKGEKRPFAELLRTGLRERNLNPCRGIT